MQDWYIQASLHWYKVRVDNILRHILLKHGAIEPHGVVDEVHVQNDTPQYWKRA